MANYTKVWQSLLDADEDFFDFVQSACPDRPLWHHYLYLAKTSGVVMQALEPHARQLKAQTINWSPDYKADLWDSFFGKNLPSVALTSDQFSCLDRYLRQETQCGDRIWYPPRTIENEFQAICRDLKRKIVVVSGEPAPNMKIVPGTERATRLGEFDPLDHIVRGRAPQARRSRRRT